MSILNSLKKEIQAQIPNPILTGYNIFSSEPPSEIEREYQCEQHKVTVKKVKEFNFAENPKMLLTFLNNGLRNIMDRLNFVEIGRSGKYFNAKDKTPIENLTMYNGYKVNFVHLEKGYFLRVDPSKKIVRSDTVLQAIDAVYAQNKDKDKEEKRNLVRQAIINTIVMSNYGKTRYYKIVDIHFKEIQSVVLEDQRTLIDYYATKYNITIKSLKQPLLVAESKDPERPIYLIPELMLMTGIPENFDEMRRKKISEQTIKAPH